jgi:hypothetical protein
MIQNIIPTGKYLKINQWNELNSWTEFDLYR